MALLGNRRASAASELDRLLRRIAGSPDEPDGWLELARWVERTGQLPPGALDSGSRERLLGFWSRHPAERGLARLILPLLGLEPVAVGGPPPPGWEGLARTGPEGGYEVATGLPLTVRCATSGILLGRIPEGRFSMGSLAAPEEEPIRTVSLPGCWLSLAPVTVAEYATWLESGRGQAPPDWEVQLEEPDRPVVQVSWDEARAFAQWSGGDLPGEALWEYAARGPEGRIHSWGDREPGRRVANRNDGTRSARDWDRHLRPVGTSGLPPAPFGHLDLGLNIEEWCRDGFLLRFGRETPDHDPAGPEEARERSLRGASWFETIESPRLRASARAAALPGDRQPWRGFRVALDDPSEGRADPVPRRPYQGA